MTYKPKTLSNIYTLLYNEQYIYICIYLSHITAINAHTTPHSYVYTLTLYSNKEETTSTTYNAIIIYRNVIILLLIIYSNTYHYHTIPSSSIIVIISSISFR